mmetsp:Transcript_22674/g.57821  ORF Transcript_22674/g.57821 Transcript_22674/m.57821 type:complete len:260 (-) Transcript_22674:157-936(-)
MGGGGGIVGCSMGFGAGGTKSCWYTTGVGITGAVGGSTGCGAGGTYSYTTGVSITGALGGSMGRGAGGTYSCWYTTGVGTAGTAGGQGAGSTPGMGCVTVLTTGTGWATVTTCGADAGSAGDAGAGPGLEGTNVHRPFAGLAGDAVVTTGADGGGAGAEEAVAGSIETAGMAAVSSIGTACGAGLAPGRLDTTRSPVAETGMPLSIAKLRSISGVMTRSTLPSLSTSTPRGPRMSWFTCPSLLRSNPIVKAFGSARYEA